MDRNWPLSSGELTQTERRDNHKVLWVPVSAVLAENGTLSRPLHQPGPNPWGQV